MLLCRDRTAERAPLCTQDPARQPSAEASSVAVVAGSRPGNARCSGVTAKDCSLSACGATRPRENGEDRGRDRTAQGGEGPGPPASQPAICRIPGPCRPRTRPLPPTHHGNRPRPAGPWLIRRKSGSAWRGVMSPVRRRAADGWIQSATASGPRTGFRFRNLLVARAYSGLPHMVRALLDLPCF